MVSVKYVGCTDEQVRFGGCSDPRGLLDEGKLYLVEHKEVHNWHTKLYLKGFESLGFNSVCFEEID